MAIEFHDPHFSTVLTLDLTCGGQAAFDEVPVRVFLDAYFEAEYGPSFVIKGAQLICQYSDDLLPADKLWDPIIAKALQGRVGDLAERVEAAAKAEGFTLAPMFDNPPVLQSERL